MDQEHEKQDETPPTPPPERKPWSAPILHRRDLIENTGFNPRGVFDDGGGFS